MDSRLSTSARKVRGVRGARVLFRCRKSHPGRVRYMSNGHQIALRVIAPERPCGAYMFMHGGGMVFDEGGLRRMALPKPMGVTVNAWATTNQP
jgi:hypothetical protein